MFRIGGTAYSPDHILAILDPCLPQRRANRSGANDSDTHEYLRVSRQSAKRFQRSINTETPKMGPEGKSRNHTSVAQVPHRTSLALKASPHRANGKSLRHAAMAAPPFREFHRVAVRI